MDPNVKSVLISKELHEKLTELKKEHGIQIRHIVESGIKLYISKIKQKEKED